MQDEFQDDALDLCTDIVLDFLELINKKNKVDNERIEKVADDILSVLTENFGIGE